MKRLLAGLAWLLVSVSPAAAQWQVQQYAIPIGRGAGVTGFNFAAPGATGIPLISQGAAANPIFGTAVVAGGGTGATTLTNHGILLGQGSSPIAATAVMTDGQLLVGQSAADPLPKTMSGDATLAASGALTIANLAITTAKIAANAVDNTKFRQSSALCVVGRSVNSTGNVADICATAGTGYVFHESSSTLEFGQLGGGALANNIISTAHLQDNAVTFAKLATSVGQIPGTRNYFMAGAGNGSVTGSDNTGFGGGVFAALTTGTENTCYGGNSTAANAVTCAAITTSKNNAMFGAGVGVALTTQAAGALGFNSGFGYGTLMWLQSGGATGSQENAGFGVNACNGLKTGIGNTCLGGNAGQGYYLPSPLTGTPSTGDYNVFVGYNTASWWTTLSLSVVIGTNAGNSFTTGGASVIIGANNLTGDYNPTGPSGTAQTGSKLVSIGYGITGVKSGTYDTLVGAEIVNCPAALSNATVIGARVDCSTVTDGTITIADGAGNKRITSTSAGVIAFPAYGVGIAHLSAAGLLSSSAVVLTSEVTGTLPVGNGGIGIASGTDGGVPYFSGTTTIASGAALGAGQVVVGGGAGGAGPTTIANGQLPATATNDNAAAGKVGEYLSSTLAYASRITLSAGNTSNITSFSLTAGDWDVTGKVNFEGDGTVVTSYTLASLSATSATSNTAEGSYGYGPAITATVVDITCSVAVYRISIASTTTIYLTANAGYGAGTLKAWGIVSARRVR